MCFWEDICKGLDTLRVMYNFFSIAIMTLDWIERVSERLGLHFPLRFAWYE